MLASWLSCGLPWRAIDWRQCGVLPLGTSNDQGMSSTITFVGIVAFSSLTTALVALVISVDKGQPLLDALAPIKSLRAFCFELIIAGSACALAARQPTLRIRLSLCQFGLTGFESANSAARNCSRPKLKSTKKTVGVNISSYWLLPVSSSGRAFR